MRRVYSGAFQRYCESSCEERATIANPAKDVASTILVTVFWTAIASSFRFFPSFSATNLVRAVGKASPVRRENVAATKLVIDSTPISVSVRAPVLVTIM